MEIQAFYHAPTFTVSFLVWDPRSKDAVVIDPVLDFEPLSWSTSTEALDALAEVIDREGLRLHYSLETHAHADHLSGGQVLRRKYDAKVAIGADITKVQQTFRGFFALGEALATDGSQFDVLLEEGQVLQAGSIKVKTIHTPGHTPACVTYQIEDAIFTGDALFMDDYGTGRCDFPGGSSDDLYTSIHEKLYGLPDETRVFVGHDYQPGNREPAWETTIGKSKARNPQLRAETGRQEFVAMRDARDATLAPPKLIFQSVQVNVNGGKLPRVNDAGQRFLKIPLNAFRKTDELGVPLKE